MESAPVTPMMQQYYQIRKQYPDCIVFFRLGDFYEIFEEQAIQVSKILGITLTKRKNKNGETPMCGVPHHSAEGYIQKLIGQGFKIALCEQVSDPNLPGIVEREVVRVITPGTSLSDIGEAVSSQYLMCFVPGKTIVGLAWVDIRTGEVGVMEGSDEEMREEISLLAPKELLLPDYVFMDLKESFKGKVGCVASVASIHNPEQFLFNHYGVKSLDGFGMREYTFGIQALALALSYLEQTQKTELLHLRVPRTFIRSEGMRIDEQTLRHLEVFQTTRGERKSGTLFSILHQTKNPMGSRKLVSFLLRPLGKQEEIEKRLSDVSFFVEHKDVREKVREVVSAMRDVERLLGRLSCKQGNARDLLALKESMKEVLVLQEVLKDSPWKSALEFSELPAFLEVLEKSLVDDPPITLQEGGMIRKGYDEKLDEYIQLLEEGKNALLGIQEREIQRTGITNLKVKFTPLFGYCIEVSTGAVSKVPADYIPKQTLATGTRYITPELKEYETKVLEAEMNRSKLEYEIFQEIRLKVLNHVKAFLNICDVLSYVDVVSCFAHIAVYEKYAKPMVVEDCIGRIDQAIPRNEGSAREGELRIEKGRHPVLGYSNPKFVANDVVFSPTERFLLLTGPNMGGKSTYLRMTGLLVYMMHIGCFVPAESATLPIVDRIFTRVGANDDLSRGQSTFMVEMAETANILLHATKQSLILLDEIGRGTSTYDGVSIAWAVTEHIHTQIQAKTIFATHYHELIDLADTLECAKNISVQVKEHEGQVIFLYKVKEGGISDSYGISVARLAGVPDEVVGRAKEVLKTLERHSHEVGKRSDLSNPQMNIFS